MIQDQNHFDLVSQAFSYKASIYDEFGKDHPNLERMRHKVYAHVLRFLKPGARVLEINAGTGTDAAFLARQGYRIHATDISPGMLAAIDAKIKQQELEGRLSSQLCSFADLSTVDGRPFDYIFSNFGGLNCIEDLSIVTWQLPHLLVPGGRLTWVIMPPVCPWDLVQAFKGNFRTATRRLNRGGSLANVEGVKFRVCYFNPRQVLDSLGKEYRLLKLEGLSILAPPGDNKSFARRFPWLYRLLARLDDRVTGLPGLRGWGDFFILSAEWVPGGSAGGGVQG